MILPCDSDWTEAQLVAYVRHCVRRGRFRMNPSAETQAPDAS